MSVKVGVNTKGIYKPLEWTLGEFVTSPHCRDIIPSPVKNLTPKDLHVFAQQMAVWQKRSKGEGMPCFTLLQFGHDNIVLGVEGDPNVAVKISATTHPAFKRLEGQIATYDFPSKPYRAELLVKRAALRAPEDEVDDVGADARLEAEHRGIQRLFSTKALAKTGN